MRLTITAHLVRLVALGFCAASNAFALDVLVVDPMGPFATIQSAVAASSAKDVILVSPGTYTEDVSVTGGGRTIIARNDCLIIGSISFDNVPANETVLLAGLDVEWRSSYSPQGTHYGTAHFVNCAGPVRVVDCTLSGKYAGYRPNVHSAAHGGPGFYAAVCSDVALIDSTITGGSGEVTVVSLPGPGGEGVLLQSVRVATIMRSLVFGGAGGIGDTGGDGGHGVRVLGATTLHLDYSLCQGGAGEDAYLWAQHWHGGHGGHGLVAGNQTIWDFQSIFAGGEPGMGYSNGAPGHGIVGASALTRLNGYPSRMHMPLIVQEGETYDRLVSGLAGERISVEFSDRPGFRFLRNRKQPRLLSNPAESSVATVGPIGSASWQGVIIESVTARMLPPGSDVEIQWSSALCLDGSGGKRQASTRPLIVLRTGL